MIEDNNLTKQKQMNNSDCITIEEKKSNCVTFQWDVATGIWKKNKLNGWLNDVMKASWKWISKVGGKKLDGSVGDLKMNARFKSCGFWRDSDT